jgi:prohibitin 2
MILLEFWYTFCLQFYPRVRLLKEKKAHEEQQRGLERETTDRQAERARVRVLKAQEEKKNIIIKAQGEQSAAELIGAAIKNNPGFVELRRIDVAREVASCLSKSQNRLVLSSDSLLLNLMDGKEMKTAEAGA